MRRFAFVIGAALPLLGSVPALAEDVVIRIEAKRGTDAAAETARTWGAQFPDVVTFPLGDGWTGIALGPMPREDATRRLEELKGAGKVPGDSFIAAAAGRNLTPATATGTAAPDAASAAPATTNAGSTFPQGGIASPQSAETEAAEAAEPVVGDLAGEDAPVVDAAPEPAIAPQPAPEAAAPAIAAPEPAAPAVPQVVLRLESSSDPAKAEAALTKWRETLPEVGLWSLPNGRSAIGFGPIDEDLAKVWLRAFRNAGIVPKDAVLTPVDDMGEIKVIGARPELGAPPAEGATPVAMPSLEDIQRALRWAGHYEGPIDGKDGPMTQKAIAEEIVRLRASPDTATAMAELIRRREAWRADMGLTELKDSPTGLALPAPMQKLQFDRAERALSIYGPKDGSGAALILFSQPGGQQELLDMAGLVTALGWVPRPERKVSRGSVILDGANDTHISHAEGRVVDGEVQGFVLIWPQSDAPESRRLTAEISDNLTRFAPSEAEAGLSAPAIAPADAAPVRDDPANDEPASDEPASDQATGESDADAAAVQDGASDAAADTTSAAPASN